MQGQNPNTILHYPHVFFGDIAYWVNRAQGIQTVDLTDLPFIPSSILNRTEILTANGLLKLTVPVEGGRKVKQMFSEVKIANGDTWKRDHLHALQSAYGKSAFWEFYKDRILDLYQNNHTYLCALNADTVQLVTDLLKMKESHNRTEIPFQLEFPPYFQVFNSKFPFAANISILDLLMNKGNKTLDYLQAIIQP
ncbi:MAG: WbqC family protein [Bacteroidetes bacterium]|nr:WbqC family protein [Bacteroidota bacterium]